ncbi:ABC transporter permease [Janibacter melonis]|uniref:ABC transporter permease n=1 Tax=Janibacter melonis TaxID=262209 RepID=UPI001749B788|nr:ABC transporter permease [Janibacter melonis]
MAAATASAPALTRAPRRRRLWTAITLAPAAVWIAALVVLPNVFLMLYSVWRNDLGTVSTTFTTENFRTLFSSDVFQLLLRRTLLIAVLSSLIATTIAYIVAYVVVRYFGRYKVLAALLVLIPLWVSYLMRIFAWKIILGENGVLAGAAQLLGLGPEAVSAFLYSQTSVILTLTYVAIPYAFLSVYTSLDRVPNHLYEASADCGASAWSTFWRVIWPLTRPGAAIGFAIAFVLTFGDYVTPAMVGGLSGTMLGTLVLQQFGTANNWPAGAAVGVVIIATGLIVLSVVSLFTRLEAQID